MLIIWNEDKMSLDVFMKKLNRNKKNMPSHGGIHQTLYIWTWKLKLGQQSGHKDTFQTYRLQLVHSQYQLSPLPMVQEHSERRTPQNLKELHRRSRLEQAEKKGKTFMDKGDPIEQVNRIDRRVDQE